MAAPPRNEVPAEGEPLAVFDLDRTLLPGSSLIPLVRALVREGMVGSRKLVTAVVRNAAYRQQGSTDSQAERVCRQVLRQSAGVERESLLDVVDRVADDVVHQARPVVRLLLDRHLEAAHFTVVLSASPQELVEAVARRIGAHRGVGTVGEVDCGRYTGHLAAPFCYGSGKLVRMRQAIGDVSLAGAHAYADSSSDLPVLLACGNPVAVHPDRTLRRTARERGWPIVQ